MTASQSSRAPMFSIVIPVTRPHYLKYSLATVLDQTFADFEVIVSFNAPPSVPALDWLPDDPRIRSVRPPEMLPQHRHWDFALSMAKGRWVMLLGDDDAIVPSLLSIVNDTIDRFPTVPIIYWLWSSFVDKKWLEPKNAGLVSVPSFSGGLELTNCRDYLDLLYGMDPRKMPVMKRLLPSIMRGMYRTDLIQTVRGATDGRLCREWTPDYSAAAQALAFTDEMLLIDMPLLSLGSTVDSMAAIYAGAPDFYRSNFEAAGRPQYKYTRVQSKAHSRPLIAETLMLAREALPERLGHYQFDITTFLAWHLSGLQQMREMGRDISRDQAEFDEVVARLDPVEQAELRRKSQAATAGAAADTQHPAAFSARVVNGLLRRVLYHSVGRKAPSGGVLSSAIRKYGVSFRYPAGSIVDIHSFMRWLGPLLGRPDFSNTVRTKRESLSLAS